MSPDYWDHLSAEQEVSVRWVRDNTISRHCVGYLRRMAETQHGLTRAQAKVAYFGMNPHPLSTHSPAVASAAPSPPVQANGRAPTDTALARTPLYVRHREPEVSQHVGRVLHVTAEREGFTGGCYRVHWADGCVAGYPGADLVMVDETGRDL